jgi:hypothetical protein
MYMYKGTGKKIPLMAWGGLRVQGVWGSEIFNRHIKVLRFLVICNGRLYPQEIFPVSFLLEAELPQGISAARGVILMKNFNGTIGNRTRELPALVHNLKQLCQSVTHATHVASNMQFCYYAPYHWIRYTNELPVAFSETDYTFRDF